MMRYAIFLIVFSGLLPTLALSETQYLDVNLSPTQVEINRRYHYQSDVEPNNSGVYILPVYNDAGELIVTFQSTQPVIARGTFTGTQVAEERKLGLLSRVLYSIGDGFNGLAEERYTSGYLREKATYVDGKKDGVNTQYYENGAIKALTHYHQNKEVGVTRRWNRHGVLVRETRRTPEGVFINEREWNSQGELRQETIPIEIEGYPDGLKETTWELGEITTFIASGVRDPSRGFVRGANFAYKLVKRERAKDGELLSLQKVNDYGRNGEQRLYYEGFSIIENMVDGKRNGVYREGDLGNEVIQGRYKNGIKVGKWQDTNSNGDIIIETYSHSGELTGIRTVQQAKTSKFIVKEHYKEGQKHGQYIHFNSEGKKDTYGVYNEGVKTGEWVESDNGVTWSGTYKEGKKTGRWRKYSSDGYVVLDLRYNAGKLEGPQYLFADNGALTLFEQRKEGLRHGKRITYENGKQTSSLTFINGQQQ